MDSSVVNKNIGDIFTAIECNDIVNSINSKDDRIVTTNRQTANYTLALTDASKLVEMNVGTANNLTVPLNATVAFPTGTRINAIQYGAGVTTIVPIGGVTIRTSGNSLVFSKRYSVVTLIKIGTNEWYASGDLGALNLVDTIASSATPTPNIDVYSLLTITALATNATVAAPLGTPTEGQKLLIRIKDNGVARALSWNAIYREGTDIALPTTTDPSKTMYIGFIYNASDVKWDVVGNVGGF